MTAPHDLDRELTAFLRDGPTELPDPSFDAVRDRMETTRQRVVLGPWRVPDMHFSARLAIGLAAVAVLAVVGINVLTVNRGLVAGPTASPAASAAAAPLPSPSDSPAAQVDASAPANSVEAPLSSSDPAPSASASPQPTPTPDAEAVRKAAAAGYLAAAGRATDALVAAWPRGNSSDSRAGAKAEGRRVSEAWGVFVAAMKQLEVPADTEADLRALIRRATVVQEFSLTQPPFDGTDAWWDFRRQLRNKRAKLDESADKVRAHLGLPVYCSDPSVCQYADIVF